MGLKGRCRRRAFSSVISALILSAVVLGVGGSIWAFSQGAMTIASENYAESVIDLTETISERFIVEQVFYDPDILSIWIYNYGEIEIEVKVTYPENTNGWKTVSSKELEEIVFGLVVSSGTELGIKVESRRDNDEIYRFVVP